MCLPNLLSVYVDADVLFSSATASQEHTAALVLLRLAEFTLIDAVTMTFTVDEAVRNLTNYLPEQIPALLQLISRSLRIVDEPPESLALQYADQAHWKDVINLAAAIQSEASVLVTYNTKDYYPTTSQIRILTPGEAIESMRDAIYDWGTVE